MQNVKNFAIFGELFCVVIVCCVWLEYDSWGGTDFLPLKKIARNRGKMSEMIVTWRQNLKPRWEKGGLATLRGGAPLRGDASLRGGAGWSG